MDQKKRGRPKLTSGHVKHEYLDVRLTPDEKEAFVKAAEIAGIQISTWARERLRQVAASELERAGVPIPFFRAIRRPNT